MTLGLTPQEHWVKIVVYGGPNQSYPIIQVLKWEGMIFQLRNKWDWYFKYRAALLQVKYPKFLVLYDFGSVEASEKSKLDIERNYLRNKIISKKAKITEFENRLKDLVDSHTGIFPIDQTNGSKYENTLAKLERLKCELQELIKQEAKL